MIEKLNDEQWRPVAVASKNYRILLSLVLLAPYLYLIQPDRWLPGLALVILGETLQLWAAANLHKDTSLAASGPYVLVRNPMYCGRFLVILGFLLRLNHLEFIIPAYLILFALYVQPRVLREEERLRGVLGKSYEEYCRQVNRWLPLRALPGARVASWSWLAVQRNHQLLVSAVAFVVQVLKWARIALL
jgi:protein-S-isoprenylcysteine O-methyltransferase Ste14